MGDPLHSDPANAIVVEDVHKVYGDVVALDGVSVTVAHGRYHGLVGPNGSGKSTLLRLMLGLARPDRGRVSRPDLPVSCGFQQPNFYPDITVRENLDVFAGLVGADDRAWRERLVEELRLEPALDRLAGDLSGGYARKLDLALALLKQPAFLLLDEPLGALDDVSKAQLLAFLERYVEMGNTVLVSTHYVEAFEPALDHVTLMHDGTVLGDSPTNALDLEGSLQAHYVRTVLEREDGEFETSRERST